MNLKNLRIGTRLFASTALVMTLLLVVTAIGITRIERIKDSMGHITANDAQERLASQMGRTARDLRIAADNSVMLADRATKQREADRVGHLLDDYAQAQRKLENLVSSSGNATAEQLARLARATEKSNAAFALLKEASVPGLSDRDDEATRTLAQQLSAVLGEWIGALDELINSEETLNVQALANADREYRDSRILIIALVAPVIVLCGVAARHIALGITVPIAEAVRVAEMVAAGDLTSEIQVDSADETGRLLGALRDMNAKLVKIVSEVRVGTEAIATGSGQIAAGNRDLSSRTEHQASSLEETASSIGELTSTVKQNADNALQANGMAADTSRIAAKGGELVAQVVDTMDAIDASSKKIVDIIAVIDGIAFQTNILALNAAVEAARAGEQGRGFAVVASEVRTLAQRSSNAAKEIKVLIDASVANVDAGTALVAQAGSTISDVVASVSRVTVIMSDIANASREQSAGIEQVNLAIGQMDQVTQQNAALVEEAAAAAGSLSDQANHLSQVVGAFKTSDTQHPSLATTERATERATKREPALILDLPGSRHRKSLAPGESFERLRA
jgi:methyl-accepting chemotaxis protein